MEFKIVKYTPDLTDPLWLKAYKTLPRWMPAVHEVFDEHRAIHPFHKYVVELRVFDNEDLDDFEEDMHISYRMDICVVVIFASGYILEIKYKPSEHHLAAAAA